jgi:hypothetical protein
MVGQEVTTAFHAVLAITPFGLHKAADKLSALDDFHLFRLPQREGIHRGG